MTVRSLAQTSNQGEPCNGGKEVTVELRPAGGDAARCCGSLAWELQVVKALWRT